MKYFFPLLVLLFMLMGQEQAQALTLDELQAQFSQQSVIRAEFRQTRQIKGLTQPLRSSGEILISREKGLWWQQKTPFVLTLLLDEQRMVQQVADQRPQVITAQSNPQMFQFNHLLRSLFQADRSVLEANFTLTFRDRQHGEWTVLLQPKTSPLDKVFNAITLEGKDYLNQIVLDDRQGDRTEIVFSDQRATPATLTNDEQQRFVY